MANRRRQLLSMEQSLQTRRHPTQAPQESQSSPLPESIQDEIAIIRGKKVTSASPSLQRLERQILGYPEKSNANHPAPNIVSQPYQSKVKSEGYDVGNAIIMSQISDHTETKVPQNMAPEVLSSVDPWQPDAVFRSIAQDAPYNTSHNYDDYGVEAFEAEQQKTSTTDVCHIPNNEHYPQTDSKNKNSDGSLDQTLVGQIENKIANANINFGSNNPSDNNFGVNNYSDNSQKPTHEVGKRKLVPKQEDSLTTTSYAPPKEPSKDKPELMDQKSVDLALQELESDLENILGNDSKADNSQQSQSQGSSAKNSDEEPDQAAATALYQGVSKELGAAFSEDPHGIFDNMSMSYANTFDAGKVDLAERFSQFDQEMELQEASGTSEQPVLASQSSAALFVDPSDLDDIDIAQDLAEITMAQSKVRGGSLPPLAGMSPTIEQTNIKPDDKPVPQQPPEINQEAVYPNIKPSIQPGNSVPTDVIEEYPAAPVILPPEATVNKDEQNLLMNIEALLDKKLQDKQPVKKQRVASDATPKESLPDELKTKIDKAIDN